MREKTLVILDNTVLSNFAKVSQPLLIKSALGGTATTVQAVMQEFNVGVKEGVVPGVDWSWLPIISLREEEKTIYLTFLQSLNKGEAACLAVAMNRGGRVLTDDRDARKIAFELQIPVSGTIGLLARLIRLGHLSVEEADNLLVAMIHSGYFSPIRSLTEIL